VSKRFKKLTAFGCPECIGDGFVTPLGYKFAIRCPECNGKGTFQRDPNKAVSIDNINEQIITNLKSTE